jgi:hypothetical protein
MASMTGMTAEQLAKLLDGPNPMPMPSYSPSEFYTGAMAPPLPSLPTYVEGGIIPPIGVAGTKRDRGSLPPAFNSLSEPWGGSYNQTVNRNGYTRRDVIQNIPAPIQTAQTYSGLDTVDPLNINNLGLTRQSFFAKQETPAERAIAEITINGGLNSPTGGLGRGRRTLPRLPTMPDPLLEEATRIGKAYKPSAKVQAALDAPAPGAAPQGRSGGLLGLLMGAFGGGQPAGQPNPGGGLAALLLSGGVQKTNPNITYTDPGIVNPGSGREINGIDIAFMPKAVQQSSRWNTGY